MNNSQDLASIISNVLAQVLEATPETQEATSPIPGTDSSILEQDSVFKIILQGTVKSPDSSTMRGYVDRGYSFSNLLTACFPDASLSQTQSVAVYTEGATELYELQDSIPVDVLDAPGEVRISYNVESGRAG